jgi:hypothetical protein
MHTFLFYAHFRVFSTYIKDVYANLNVVFNGGLVK